MKVSFSKENVVGAAGVPGGAGVAGINPSGIASNAPRGPVLDAEVVTPAAGIPSSPVTALVPVAPAPVALRPENALPFDDNDISFNDIYFPKINLVHNTGDLGKIFLPGEIVLNQTYVIHTSKHLTRAGTDPLKLTVIGFRKQQFVEKISGGGERGALVDTAAEVEALGGTLNYNIWKQNADARLQNPALPVIKRFETLATALVLIERPAHCADSLEFPYEFEGKFYALALWGMKGTAFTNAAKDFYTARKIGFLRKPPGYLGRSWLVTTRLEPYKNGNSAWIPVVTPCAEPNSPEFVAFIRDAFGACN
jgi:hypothetical protein